MAICALGFTRETIKVLHRTLQASAAEFTIPTIIHPDVRVFFMA